MYNNLSATTGASIKYSGKNTYIRDANFFIKRIKDITIVKGIDITKMNLNIYLRSVILEEYTGILIEKYKRFIKFNNGIKK